MVVGVSKTLEVVDLEKLDADECEGGVQAFSALMYQYGGVLDARVLVTLWLASISMPRIAKYFDEKRKEKAFDAQAGHPPQAGGLKAVPAPTAPLPIAESPLS